MGRDRVSIRGETDDVDSARRQPSIHWLWQLEDGSTREEGPVQTGRSASGYCRRRREEECEARTPPREALGSGARSRELRAGLSTHPVQSAARPGLGRVRRAIRRRCAFGLSSSLTPAAIRLSPDDLGAAAPRRLADQRAGACSTGYTTCRRAAPEREASDVARRTENDVACR
jgi:hypothetical protein